MQQRTSRMHLKKDIIGKKEISWVPDQMVVTSSSTPSSTTPPDQTKKLLWFMQKGRRRPQQQMTMALKMPAIRRPRSSSNSRFTFSSSSSSSTIFHGLRGILICVSFGLVCITIAAVLLCMREEEEVSSHPREITPFPTKLVSALPQFQGAHRERLYWGTYRPNLYLGIRARFVNKTATTAIWPEPILSVVEWASRASSLASSLGLRGSWAFFKSGAFVWFGSFAQDSKIIACWIDVAWAETRTRLLSAAYLWWIWWTCWLFFMGVSWWHHIWSPGEPPAAPTV